MVSHSSPRAPGAPTDAPGAAGRAGPVRVVHVVYRLQAGGMEHGVIKICNALDGGRIRSSVCSTTPATEVKGLLRPDVPLFECRRRAGNDPRLVWTLFRLFRQVRPDIVHTHSWGTLVEGTMAARLAGVPALVHGEHGTMEERPLQLRVQRLFWSRADHVLAVSSRLADRMAAATAFPRERITVIANGVDTARFGGVSRSQARSALGLPHDAVVVGTIGRLVPVKSQQTLVEAIGILRDRGREVIAVVAGDGPLRAALTRKADALALQRRVQLLGHRSDPEVVLAALDVFALPSTSEGMSNTILEAMASGLPVVATAVGGNTELVEEGVTGLLVPPADPTALADALEAILAGGRLGAMGCAARARAQTAFSIRAMVQQYESLYLACGRR